MIVILLGAPGSGKGTQAKFLAKKYNIPHISTGDIFRYNIKNNTPLGNEAKTYMDKGLLVPDKLTISIVDDRLNNTDCDSGYILDGFPRTISQANMLKQLLLEKKEKLDFVLNIVVSEQSVVKRLSGRRMCTCGEIYHIIRSKPKVDNICDKCNKKLYIRDDDQPETIKKRLAAYHNETQPLEEYYKESGVLIDINGEKTPKEVFLEVLKVI